MDAVHTAAARSVVPSHADIAVVVLGTNNIWDGWQSSDQVASLVYQYYDASGTGTSAPGAAFKSQYYEGAIASVTSVDDLLANPRLVSYLETAFGLDPSEQSTQLLRSVLTSDLSDPDSVANKQSNDAYRKLAAAFNFNTDGSINGDAAQSASQIDGVVSSFATNNTAAVQNFQNTEINFYKTDIAKIGSVSDFINDTGLYDFVLSAFGIDPSKTSKLTIEKVLESDASNPSSFANMSHNSAYSKLAAAFNFDANGNAKTASSAQVNASLVSTIQLYNSEIGDPTVQNDQTTDDDAYYGSTIGTIKNVEGIVGKLEGTVDQLNNSVGRVNAQLDQVEGIVSSVRVVSEDVSRLATDATDVVHGAKNIVVSVLGFVDNVQSSVQKPINEVAMILSALGTGIRKFRQRLGGTDSDGQLLHHADGHAAHHALEQSRSGEPHVTSRV